jgi:hypothetical protein
MRSLQNSQLFHDSQQEEDQGKTGREETLQSLQEAHLAQRDKII